MRVSCTALNQISQTSLGWWLSSQHTPPGMRRRATDTVCVLVVVANLACSFEFDCAFDEMAATTAVYQTSVLPLVTSVIGGQSAMAILTGEEASGKVSGPMTVECVCAPAVGTAQLKATVWPFRPGYGL